MTESRSIPWKVAQSILYDTLIRGFWRGYFDSTTGAADFDAKLHRAAIVLIELAITVMADFVA